MGTFRHILVCLVIQSLLTSILSSGHFQMNITPTQINIGLSESLNVNCTFSVTDNPNMAALISLILSRASTTGQAFTELATVNDFTGHNVNMLTTESGTGTGFFDSATESFLNLKWDYPTEIHEGEYKCTAQGFDSLGHIIVLNDVIQVTANQPSIDDWRDKVREMDIEMKELKQIVSQIKQNGIVLDESVKHLKENVTRLANERLNKLSVMFESDYLTYKNHKYYISRYGFYRIEAAYLVCHAYGGWFVEIDDAGEYQAIQTYVKTTSGIDRVIIAGTDEEHEGTWVLPSTNQPLPYIDWGSAKPNGGNLANCLYLYAASDWRMGDMPCQTDTGSYSLPYMCEIPDL